MAKDYKKLISTTKQGYFKKMRRKLNNRKVTSLRDYLSILNKSTKPPDRENPIPKTHDTFRSLVKRTNSLNSHLISSLIAT